jgi:ketopantoate reductase
MFSSTPDTTALVKRLMREVITVAEAKGLSMHPVGASTGEKGDLVEVLVNRVLEKPLESSMWNDLKAHKRIEVEVRSPFQ